MRATWYVLESGEAVDPREVSRNEDGRLAHANGLVAMRSPDCPRSRSVDVESAMAVARMAPVLDLDGNEPNEGAPAPVKTTDMKAEPAPAPAKQPRYKRRGL